MRRVASSLGCLEPENMASFRIGTIVFPTIGDDEIGTLLEAASQEGGSVAFPSLYALFDPTAVDDPGELMDELVRLAGTEAGREHPVLIGTLRDDLMQALAAAGEG
jgi:hypothetical protein